MTGAEDGAGYGWMRILVVAWIAELLATLGFSLTTPFMPLFLRDDLGVTDPASLARWSGMIGCAAGLAMAVASPVWGLLADRRGRKAMLVRALAGGAVTTAAIGLAQTPLQVFGLRIVQGATSGTVSAATALVASETPPRRAAWALGVLSASVALGGALGPVLGGVGAAIVGFRAVYLAGGVLAAVATIAALVLVHERQAAGSDRHRPSLVESLRRCDSNTLRVLVVLIVAQGLLTYCQVALQQLAVLKIVDLGVAEPARLTGLAFGAGGVLTAGAALSAGGVARRFGYRWPTAAIAMLVAGTALVVAAAPSGLVVAIGIAAFGALYGVIGPLVAAGLGLFAPREIQATAFGLNASALALGSAIGPLVTATVVADHGTTLGLGIAAGVGVALAGMLALWSRDPGAAPVTGDAGQAAGAALPLAAAPSGATK